MLRKTFPLVKKQPHPIWYEPEGIQSPIMRGMVIRFKVFNGQVTGKDDLYGVCSQDGNQMKQALFSIFEGGPPC